MRRQSVKKIKNKDEFFALQKDISKKVKDDNKIRILVGLGTCGIAAGAGVVYDELERILKERKFANVDLVKVGCVGYCHSEPTVEVVYPEGESVLLGNVTKDKVSDMVALHVASKCETCDFILGRNISCSKGGK